MNRARKAQMEMIGLVMVVVLLVIGIVLYVSFSGNSDDTVEAARGAKTYSESNSFLTAMTQATIPACNKEFYKVAADCMDGQALSCDDPCGELQRAMDAMIAATALKDMKYNLSLVNTSVQSVSDCASADPRVARTGIAARPYTTIPLGNGREMELSLALCR